jgi:uncharacterized protein
MPVPPRLSVTVLGVRDFPKMRAFYEGLGWTTNSTAEDFAAFPLGGAVLALYPIDLLAEDARVDPPRGDGFRGVSCGINVDRREEVDAALAAAAEAGARILKEAVDAEWGGRSGYFADPEGNAWEVAWHPDARFDERGAIIWPS